MNELIRDIRMKLRDMENMEDAREGVVVSEERLAEKLEPLQAENMQLKIDNAVLRSALMHYEAETEEQQRRSMHNVAKLFEKYPEDRQ